MLLLNGLSHILRTEHKLFKSVRLRLHLLHWNMGYLRVLYLALSYLLCTQPLLGILFENMGWTFISTQLYISFQPGASVSKETAISCREACMKGIKIWKLNNDKTELIVITTHSYTSKNQHIGINIGDSLITPSSEPLRNLGILFGSICSLNDYVFKICKSISYNL